eukprot:6175785-Pleurochrysis_carterae.AAC.1
MNTSSPASCVPPSVDSPQRVPFKCFLSSGAVQLFDCLCKRHSAATTGQVVLRNDTTELVAAFYHAISQLLPCFKWIQGTCFICLFFLFVRASDFAHSQHAGYTPQVSYARAGRPWTIGAMRGRKYRPCVWEEVLEARPGRCYATEDACLVFWPHRDRAAGSATTVSTAGIQTQKRSVST